MGAIRSLADDTLRDDEVAGLPGTLPRKVPKSELRALFALIESSIEILVDGMILNDAVVYGTRAALFLDVDEDPGARGVVWNDPNPAYRGLYLWNGAGWDLTSIYVRIATDEEAIAGESDIVAVSPGGLKAARGHAPGYQVLNVTDYYGENLAWALGGPAYLVRGVYYRDIPLSVGLDGYVRARLHPSSFLAAESATFLDPGKVIALDARGQVFEARKITADAYGYKSTQDGFTLPYRVWQDDPGPTKAQLLATSFLAVHMGYGQSWRSGTMLPEHCAGPFLTQGEPYTAYTFLNVFNVPLQMVGVESQIELITGFTALKAGWGITVDSAAAQSLSRIRRAMNHQIQAILTWSAAYPGYRWDQLRPGSEPWTTLLGYIAASRTYAAKYGLTPYFEAVGITEGAAGSAVDPVDCYAALGTMCADWDALNLNAGITLPEGKDGLLRFFIDTTPAVANATQPYPQAFQQVAFARANPNGRTYLIGPRAQFPYVDLIHHTHEAEGKHGELESWVKHVVLDLGLEWEPLWITYSDDDPDIAIAGNTITIHVSTPIGARGGLVRDTTTIEPIANDGFVVKVGGATRVINAVSLGEDTITLTMALPIAGGATAEISNGAYGPGSVSGGHSGVWTNVKMVGEDSRFFTDDGVPLTIDHWLVHFKVEVVA